MNHKTLKFSSRQERTLNKLRRVLKTTQEWIHKEPPVHENDHDNSFINDIQHFFNNASNNLSNDFNIEVESKRENDANKKVKLVDRGSSSRTSIMVNSSSNNENKMTPPPSIHSKIKPTASGLNSSNPLASHIPTMHHLSHSRSLIFIEESSVHAGTSNNGICNGIGNKKRKKGKETDFSKKTSKKIKTSNSALTTFKSPNHLNSPMPGSLGCVNTSMLESTKHLNTLNHLNTTAFLPRNLLKSSQKQPKQFCEKAAEKSIANPVEKLNILVKEQKENNEIAKDWKQKSADLCNKYTQEENNNKLSAKDQAIPPIEASLFAELATGYVKYRPQWEMFEYLGDSVLEHCLLKIAKGKYLIKYSIETIVLGVMAMATNKVLAAYAITTGLHKLNRMEFLEIKKLHADAFEAYIGTYYIACGEQATCNYLEKLMSPLFDAIIQGAESNKDVYHLYGIASAYFSMPWICERGHLF
ncbi:12094_t:CDS:2 [Dentiscutata heterogama]|uniref:12094_t:CDS:1 n=1 Tax=Dentiscutata heterogama TaxID=1316150 RepID=A0ACA9M1X2_9GLOM|nr:12094_t:CDS:2 [Dentiscutata heterogama]